ncbi:MAG TPA: DUF309 domain-containing protein [Blastocatellia bacterium]|nr:DUF309 domain-containing protein [Blastocatellia bacterium]HMV82867.1 DUF309 domain-containing protein [Blastocatellia bacterium]HMX24414.1 DUF309 domain-containing protein [Blastocatellia bacterium]HMY72825.1 DUF309 domain-containing protein [Blastocatellia bacterium]HMZ19852.1 DUF309 domain-containing protein [Blastocatellia bacterium]
MVAESGSERSQILTELPEEFLRGVALFNDGGFYECHEVWETVWLRATGDEREFLHAMIQAAAAMLHARRGNWKGAQSVGARAMGKLEKLPAVMMQVETREFLVSFKKFLAAEIAAFPRITFQDKGQNKNP